MSKADMWSAMLKEFGGIVDWVTEALTSTASFSDDTINKQRSKELAQLAKKEPNLIKVKPYINKSKETKYHKKIPKQKEQKFFNRHTREND